MVICIIIIYLKYKVNGVEMKTFITGDDFKLITMIFIDDGDFMTQVNVTYRKWDEVLQQHEITVD